MNVKRVYTQWNSMHYFIGAHCPLDGWSSPVSHELAEAARRLEAQGQDLSLAGLRAAGASDEALEHVIEFGAAARIFDSMEPQTYLDDELEPLPKL